ncbi:Aldo/keto reductase-like protein [Lasiosphaeris hirsuta]|uniref:Aldo/keto reductase-like protein n=1 Tax=Lasiosphaeris hirsuta TaxID=260670 RepID=A0AA39ZVR4_9PEZI|nr:Aldo/keto reductase-like protein [Lasiosphaeris hirsuta]
MAPPAKLPTRKLGKNGPEIPALGFGLMGLSIAYGAAPPDSERLAVLDRAWELGCTHWDSADAYGDSEDLLGKWFALHPERRADIFLASKFGIKASFNADNTMNLSIDSSPEYARQQAEASLKRLGTDYIDLYYVHRVDDKTPIEKTIEELVKLKAEGKIRHIGISAASAKTLRRASAVAPIDAFQVEYSPWALEIEDAQINLLNTCRELGISIIAYSPLGRGFLAGQIRSPSDFEPTDFRRLLSRYSEENFPKNLVLVDRINELAKKKGCTGGQLTMAWILAQGNDFFPIPGTRNIKYLEENIAAVHVQVSDDEEKEIRKLLEDVTIIGSRNPEVGFLPELNDSVPL